MTQRPASYCEPCSLYSVGGTHKYIASRHVPCTYTYVQQNYIHNICMCMCMLVYFIIVVLRLRKAGDALVSLAVFPPSPTITDSLARTK